MAAPVAIVDFSWVLYTFRYSYNDMARVVEGKNYFPIGHVYGAIRVIQELARHFKVVILSIDSRSPYRYSLLPGYKSGRHTPKGDPYEDYPIMTDLWNVLKLCTYQRNVFYIKHTDLESDDIIASWIASSVSDEKRDLYCYFNDVDILQTPGRYHWFRSFHEPEVDRSGYLREKFGLDLNYLPVWWKVVRGDRSDGIPSSIPRFPTKKLIEICLEAVGDERDVPWFISKIGEETVRADVERNYFVVCPRIVPLSDFRLKRLVCSEEEARKILQYYQITDFALAV